MQTLSNLVIGASFLLLEIAWWLRLRAVIGINRSEKLSKKQEEALLKAWEDYELGINRSERLRAKSPWKVPVSGDIAQLLAFSMPVIVAVSVVAGVHWGAPEPFTVGRPLGAGWMSLCVFLAFLLLAFLVWMLTITAQSIRGHWQSVSRRPPRNADGGGGVADEWLDGPQVAAVKSRPRRSAASG